MIDGAVSELGLPTILVTVGGRSWQATIDTGFNGDLELPQLLRSVVNARFIARTRWLLAAGQAVEEDTYEVEFPFDGRMVRAEATFVTGDEILIGTRLLQDYRLEIDFVARTVVLERVG